MPPTSSTSRRGLGRALFVSLSVHAGLLVAVPPLLTSDAMLTVPESQEEATSQEPERLRVEVVPESEPDPPEPEKPERASEESEPEAPPEPDTREQREDEKKKEKKEKQKRELESYNRKAVVQKTNEENPEEADFVSKQANEVDEETRARETVQEFKDPADNDAKRDRERAESTEETEQQKLGSREAVASRAKKPSKPPPRPSKPRKRQRDREEREKPQTKDGKGPEPTENREKTARQREQKARPDRPPLPTVDDYSEVFDEGADRRRRAERREKGVGSDMYREIEKSEGSVEATLENYIPEVKPGNHTSVNAKADVAATYINRIHSKIHPRWGGTYLPRLDRQYGPSHPLSDPDLNAVLEVVIDGSTGETEEVTIASSSGITRYDMEAVTIVKQVGPHPEAPDPLVSPDGNVYLHWNFWRNQRQCGTFGVSLYKLLEDGSRKQNETGGAAE